MTSRVVAPNRAKWPAVSAASVSAGLGVGYIADRILGDPRRHHPVAWFGSFAMGVEHATWAPTKTRGLGFLFVTLTPPVAACVLLDRRFPKSRWVTTAVAAWAAFGGRSLEREALAVHALLVRGDIPGARQRILSLVGRDTSHATPDDLARAVVESLAENQSDAVAATLFWGAMGGAPGIVLHRCANTLDAMVGHRSDRYREFGWAAARLDDVLNWAPSRLSMLATAAATGSWARASQVFAIVKRDAHRHPSPNAGPVEAAAAAALGVRLGGTNVYGGAVEDRGELGDGRTVEVRDIPRAMQLERCVGRIVLGACLVAATLRPDVHPSLSA